MGGGWAKSREISYPLVQSANWLLPTGRQKAVDKSGGLTQAVYVPVRGERQSRHRVHALSKIDSERRGRVIRVELGVFCLEPGDDELAQQRVKLDQ